MPVAPVYSEDQRDCLQEICNVAMGQAADTIARTMDVFVTLPIPIIKIIKAEQLAASVQALGPSTGVYAASQLFASSSDGSPLSGLALVMLSANSVDELQQLMPGVSCEQQRITQTCQSMAQSCLDALSQQWGLGFHTELPQLVGFESLQQVCKSVSTDWNNVLMVEINYKLEQKTFNGELLLLFPDQAIAAMAERLDHLLA
jgi:chemotaxis protein CheY-P-specific phosphatase CheC